MESGGYTGHDYDVCAWADKLACTLACMHTFFWHAYALIWAKFDWIRVSKVSMESGEYAGHV